MLLGAISVSYLSLFGNNWERVSTIWNTLELEKLMPQRMKYLGSQYRLTQLSSCSNQVIRKILSSTQEKESSMNLLVS